MPKFAARGSTKATTPPVVVPVGTTARRRQQPYLAGLGRPGIAQPPRRP